MTEERLEDHPQRYALSNELHARPFPELRAPCHAVVLAIKQPDQAENRDPEADRAHLHDLLDRHGAAHPPPGGSHFSGRLGRTLLKWERHTEFVSYTIYADGVAGVPFYRLHRGDISAGLAQPGSRKGAYVSAGQGRAGRNGTDIGGSRTMHGCETGSCPKASPCPVSLTARPSPQATFASMLRGIFDSHCSCDPIWVRDAWGGSSSGWWKSKTYKSIAMLTLPVARQVAARVAELDGEMSSLVRTMVTSGGGESQTLDRLLEMSAEIEALSSSSAFRFGAAEAYAAIVHERISALREERVMGRANSRGVHVAAFRPGDANLPLCERPVGRTVPAGNPGGNPAAHSGGGEYRSTKPGASQEHESTSCPATAAAANG